MATTDPDTSAPGKNEKPESNIASYNDSPDSLNLLDPNPGGIILSDDLLIIYYITGVDWYIDLLHYLALADSLDAENLSIEVSVDEDIEGKKYECPDRAN